MSQAVANAAASAPAPLVSLTEDETLFRDTVRQFADETVRPYVKEMDERRVSSSPSSLNSSSNLA